MTTTPTPMAFGLAPLPLLPYHTAASSASHRRSPQRRPRPARRTLAPRMVEGDANVVGAVAVAVLGVTAGVGALVWAEKQGERSSARVNQQPCVDCNGAAKVECDICKGTGLDPIFGEEKGEPCNFCEGAKMITCLNCNGSGIQPRFLDRLSPEDFMD